VEVDLDRLILKEPDLPVLKELFAELEFRRLLLELSEPEAEAGPPGDYQTIDSLEQLDRLIDELAESGEFAIDLETDSLDSMRAAIVGISLAREAGVAYYLPLSHRDPDGNLREGNLPAEEALARLKPLLSDPAFGKIGQNIKYDWAILANHGLPMRGVNFDTMVASYCLDPGRRQHNLDHLAMEHLRHRMIPITDLIGKGRGQVTFDQVDIDKSSVYACEDADYTFQLKLLFRSKLEEIPPINTLFDTLEIPLTGVLMEMERAGVRIDVPFFGELSERMAGELARLETDIHKMAGVEFNINSPKQLSEILFEKMGLPVIRKTKTGFSTDAGVLTELAREHELPRRLLRYRELMKLKTTYVDALPALVNPKTGRLHTSFNQTVAATGRLSSSDPNLQNIPIRTEEGREIRRGFIAGSENNLLLSCDYSQVELRVMAHLSGDEGLIRAFEQGEDIHRATAAKIFGLPPDAVTPELRGRAKEVNFGVIFGMGEFGLSNRLGISFADAADFIEGYFGSYPKVKEFMERVVAEARDSGYAETLLGRRRYLPELRVDNRNVRQGAERVAINTSIQGTAADLIKTAMIRIQEKMNDFSSIMILQVHDELLFDAVASELEELKAMVTVEMENALELSVPLVVETGTGINWAEAH
jgi:DNA polymerase-1